MPSWQRLAPAFVVLAACGPPPSSPGRPISFPTLDADRPFDPRPMGLADLRSIAGAAAIALEVGPGPAVTTRGCEAAGPSGASGPLHGGATCYRCPLATVDQPPGEALHPLEVPLRTLAETLLQYPHSFLRVAHIEKIALCAQLTSDRPLEDDQRVAGLAEGAAHRLMVSLASTDRARPDATLHHEIFHLFDFAAPRDGDHDHDPDWERLNPQSFRYGAKPPIEIDASFINDYARTALAEDKASVFEYLMAYPDELCARAADDPLLLGKAQLLLDRIEAAVPQNLGEFARRRAPCLVRR